MSNTFHLEANTPMDSTDVAVAATAYRNAFGHGVPIEVQRRFAPHPGPLLVEIRQAIALGRPVPGWRALSRAPDMYPDGT
ncbi:MAG TPA: hypothetical protein VFO44_02095 [Steroidobacteraceae bacterium]|nr:hypothetical protein [Steroidobacteraceae bacterium]